MNIEKLNTPLCQLGEGLCWDETRNVMWYLDIELKKIYNINHTTLEVATFDTDKTIGMITLTKDNDLLVFADNEIFIFNPENNSYKQTSQDFVGGNTDVLSNDGKVDRNGGLVVGTKHTTCEKPTATLYYYKNGDKQGIPIRKDITVCNGPAFSPDGTKMYFADTPTQIINVYDYDNGVISNKQTFATEEQYPDGMTVDSAGYLWNAIWNGHSIKRYNPAGELVLTVDLPTSLNVTNVCFGGADLKTLYITSAYSGMTDEQRTQYPGSGALFRVDLDDISGITEVKI